MYGVVHGSCEKTVQVPCDPWGGVTGFEPHGWMHCESKKSDAVAGAHCSPFGESHAHPHPASGTCKPSKLPAPGVG